MFSLSLFRRGLLATLLFGSLVASGCGDDDPSCPSGEQDFDLDGVCAPACSADTCGDTGSCDDSSGAALCACEPEYAGATCADCAPGFQDGDSDGVCTPGCSDTTCSGFGSCADATGEAVCDCVEGHDGVDCSECRAGFEDANGDGSCEPACGAMFCSGNGTCDNSTGSIVCACVDGHTGDDCSECAAGFQDEDGDGRCEPACDATTCSGNGTCDDATGRATCSCDFGFGGLDCAVCASGFQDNDGDGACALACTDETCSGNGSCDDTSGAPVCTCDDGFTGAVCDGCDAGFQDRDGDGVCTAACAADSCATTGVCDDSSGTLACICATGYAGDDCSACDVGFQDTDGDGVCTAACDATVCGAGACEDTTGVIDCTCPDGFRGDRCEYRRVLSLDLPDDANWDADADVPYTIDDRAMVTAFDRVGYYFALDGLNSWTTFDAPTDVARRIGVPTDWVFDQAVTNLTVESNVPSVTPVTNGSLGNIEFWSHCSAPSPFGYDADDELQEHRPDCYGSMGIYHDGEVLMSYSRWSQGGTDDVALGGTSDEIFQGDIVLYTTRLLEVYVRETDSCTSTSCGAGTCDDTTGTPICACPTGTTGLGCATCDEALGYDDRDNDGTCELGCQGDACDDLYFAELTTGVHAFETAGGTVPMYVDNDTNGGGWLLIGRGRDGWDWTNRGRGAAATVTTGLGTPAAFEPAYVSTAIVEGLRERLGMRADELEIWIRRAANLEGTEWQDVLVTFDDRADWTWQLPVINPAVDATFGDSVLGTGGTETNDRLRDVRIGNDHTRMFTYPWNGHGGRSGFAYGTTVRGQPLDTSFLWELTTESHALPYTEVYIRPRCPIGSTGAACDQCAFPYQDNDGDGTCTPGCDVTTCGATEACTDASGTATCLAVSGASCAAILAADATAADGSYAIDPDGAGAAPPLAVECDMTGGGWTVIALEDFTTGYARGWSQSAIDSSDCQTVYGPFLGRMSTQATSKDFALGAVPHTEARVELDYVVMDSWDNEDAIVRVDGAEIFRMTYVHTSGAANTCGGSWNEVGPVRIAGSFAHSADVLTLEADATLNSGVGDESFGIDNVRIAIR